jgi:tetratricopeptide (TPR) repeat protein
VLGLRATVLARQGRHEEALSAADAAEAPLAATESPGVLAQTLLERATALRLAGRVADADAAVRRALDLYERKGNEPGARRVRALLGAPVA